MADFVMWYQGFFARHFISSVKEKKYFKEQHAALSKITLNQDRLTIKVVGRVHITPFLSIHQGKQQLFLS